jgi:hypothetical protein
VQRRQAARAWCVGTRLDKVHDRRCGEDAVHHD